MSLGLLILIIIFILSNIYMFWEIIYYKGKFLSTFSIAILMTDLVWVGVFIVVLFKYLFTIKLW